MKFLRFNQFHYDLIVEFNLPLTVVTVVESLLQPSITLKLQIKDKSIVLVMSLQLQFLFIALSLGSGILLIHHRQFAGN